MTEEEAADKLCVLLNEIEDAGHAVQIEPNFGSGHCLSVGEGALHLTEPDEEKEPWEVRGV